MFDFEFDEFEDPASEDELRDLVDAYERSLHKDADAYFDSEALEHIATYYADLLEVAVHRVGLGVDRNRVGLAQRASGVRQGPLVIDV